MHTLVNSLLAAPSSMTPEYVNQLKEVNKEESTGLAQQLAHKLKLDAASRGTSFSGNEAMRGEKIGEAMNADIIRQNRAVDMQKAQTDRSDLLSALGIGQGYNQSAQANYFTNQDQARSQRALELQDKLGTGGLANDSARLNESSRAFDLSHALALRQFQEQQRQFNNQLGFNYNSLD
jgi:hypothetical protein